MLPQHLASHTDTSSRLLARKAALHTPSIPNPSHAGNTAQDSISGHCSAAHWFMEACVGGLHRTGLSSPMYPCAASLTANQGTWHANGLWGCVGAISSPGTSERPSTAVDTVVHSPGPMPLRGSPKGLFCFQKQESGGSTHTQSDPMGTFCAGPHMPLHQTCSTCIPPPQG